MLTKSQNLTFKSTLLILGLISGHSALSELPAELPDIPDCGDSNKGNQLVSYHFDDIDLASVMMLVSDASAKEINGMELLQGKKVSASADCVDSIEFAVALLLVNGFDLNSDGDKWIITES